MSPAELLARALPRSVPIGEPLPGGNAVVHSWAQEVGLLMSGMAGAPRAMLMLKFWLDAGAYPELARHLMRVCERQGRVEPDQREWFIREAITESVAAPVCPACRGTGWTIEVRAEKLVGRTLCKRCAGSGHRQISHAIHAGRLGVSRHVWRHRMAGDYEQLLRVLADWESEGLRVVWRNLTGRPLDRRAKNPDNNHALTARPHNRG